MNKPIRILFQSRTELFQTRGGDTFQMEHTKKAIEALDSRFKIDINNDISVKNIKDYDVVNLFNLDWISETYLQAKHAYENNIPIAVSAIHHPIDRIQLYEKLYRFDFRRIVNPLISNQEYIDIAKNIYRSINYPKKLLPTLTQLRMGISVQQKEVLRMASVILVQTDKEKEEIIRDFGIPNKRYEKVLIGADSQTFLNADKQPFLEYLKTEHNLELGNKKILISVGRIEPRKNQLTLIKAFHNLGNLQDQYLLIFVGAINKYHAEYSYRFRKAVNEDNNILYVGQIPQKLVASAMACPGICVQPSWFETIGLTNVEAFMAGMKVVSSTDRLYEFFGNKITYCEPQDPSLIANSILKAHSLGYPSYDDRKYISDVLNWQETARQSIEVYLSLIKNETM